MNDLWEADMYTVAGAGTFPPVRVVRKADYDGMEAAWRTASERGDMAVARLAEAESLLRDAAEALSETSAYPGLLMNIDALLAAMALDK